MGFYGRDAELAALAGQAEVAAATGRLRVVLILAGPGMGASGLIEEYAHRSPHRVLRAVVPRRPGSLRVWHRLLDDLEAAPMPGASEDAVWAMERSVIGGLAQACARSGPLVCVLDDLHRADEDSLTLLAELADRAPPVPVILIAVVRPDAEAALPSGPAVHRLWLRGLEPEDVGEYLTELTGRPTPAELAQQLWRRTDGAPGVLSAIAGQLRPTDDGRIRVALRWPDPLRAQVETSLAALSGSARRALDVACVVGREFDLSIVEQVIGDGTLAAIDEAVSAGLLGVLPDQVFTFTSALTREMCYDALGLAGAAEIHEQVADALVGLGARVGERAPTIAELAHHLVQATVLGGADRLDRAIAAAVAAAQAALADGDHSAAVGGYAVAADLASRNQWSPSLLGRLYVGLGSAYLALAGEPADEETVAGHLASGREALRAAARLARHRGDAALLADVALGLGFTPERDATAPPSDPERRATLAEALASLGGLAEADPSVLARLRARLALELRPAPEAEELAEAARAAAYESADPRAIAEALLAADRIDLVEHRQAIREASVLGDNPLLARAHLSAARALLRDGELAAGDRQLAATATLPVPWAAHRAFAHRALLAGRLGDAARHARSALDAGHAAGREAAWLAYAAQLTAIRLVAGQPGDIAETLRCVEAPQPLWVSAAAAWAAGVAGEEGFAAALVDEVLAAGSVPDAWTALLLARGMSAGHPGVSAVLAALDSAPVWIVVGQAAASGGPAALVRARLLTAAGDLPAAARCLEEAGRLVAGTPWLPWLRLARARWLLARGAAGDGESAATELKAARAGAVDRGLSGLIVEIDAVVPAEGAGLTRRERDVCELAVGGASAREIAERLVIGERTVETHLANIYRKLGVRNRVELITRMGELSQDPRAL